MLPRKMTDATRVLGESQGYLGLPIRDVVVRSGVGPCPTCGGLRVSQTREGRDVRCVVCGGAGERALGPDEEHYARAMESEWALEPEEIAALAAGGVVVLQILGTSHPPVMLSVAAAEPKKLASEGAGG